MLSNNSIINELPLGKNNPKVIWNTFSIKNLFKLKTNFFSLVSLMGTYFIFSSGRYLFIIPNLLGDEII